jgi:N-acetylglutamate synthase-like GNAT family acetyltransferase
MHRSVTGGPTSVHSPGNRCLSPAGGTRSSPNTRRQNILLVAVDAQGELVAFAAAHPQDCEMYLLFVHPREARRGVGRQLLDAVHDAMRAAGCREAFLYTHEFYSWCSLR